jgi:hypothetical protein
LPSPATSTGIISGTGTGIVVNETEASPNTITAGGAADLRGPEERFRATMQRYSVFENEIAVLRRSVSPPGSSRSLTVAGMGGQQQLQTASPPRLPPLELSPLRDEGDVDEEEEDPVQPLGKCFDSCSISLFFTGNLNRFRGTWACNVYFISRR